MNPVIIVRGSSILLVLFYKWNKFPSFINLKIPIFEINLAFRSIFNREHESRDFWNAKSRGFVAC